jgi:hypothetical protein
MGASRPAAIRLRTAASQGFGAACSAGTLLLALLGCEHSGVPPVLWEDLGTFTIDSGTLVVQLTNLADGWVYADAIRVERLA